MRSSPTSNESLAHSPRFQPAADAGPDSSSPVPIVLDVRPLLAKGTTPCQAIDEAIPRVPIGGTLVLLVPFEPVPLYDKLRAHGFDHEAEQLPGEVWRVTFRRRETLSQPPTVPAVCACTGPVAVETAVSSPQVVPLRIDARRLEPPQPMVRILEALQQLPQGGTLEAHTDRKPIHLLPLLEARGYSARNEVQPDGSCLTIIRRGNADPLPVTVRM